MPVITSTTTSTTILAPDLIPIAFACPFSMPAGSQVLIDYTVKNQGQLVATAPWYDYVVFSTDMTLGGDSAIYVYQRVANLAVNATYSLSPTVTMPNVPAGSYYLFFQTDGAGQVSESTHEANNINGAVAITITVPDLTPTAFSAPASAAAGSQISVSYTVKNQGSASAGAPWSEQVVLSTNATFGADTTLATFARAVGLAVNGTYTATQMVTLPSVAPGTYYLFFQTDAADQVYEGGADANNVRGPVTIVIS
ncbi:MAG: CARDB domain-containing protein [Candidatus Binatia bacterium]